MVDDTYTYLGNFSAVEPVHTRYMVCYECKVSWHGCWDNFMCPKCGKGELPKFGFGFGFGEGCDGIGSKCDVGL